MSRISVVVVAAIAGVAIVLGALFVLEDRAAPSIIIDDPRPDATIVVSVEGAVATPGVYELPGDARMNDALTAAGGTTDDADLSTINLAMRLLDGERIVVFRLLPVDDAGDADAATGVGDQGGTEAGPATAGGRININTANADQLATLPGIGPALAQRIIDHRTAQGPFRSVDELERVSGISARMVDELRSLVTVGT